MKPPPPPLVWPTLLEFPPPNALLVYLDLNHWIGLAQACVGHRKGDIHHEALEACHAARSAGTATFVLSATIYAEMQKIKDPMQRLQLAHVMEELTGFDTLVSRVVVMELELSAAVDPLAKLPNPRPRVNLVGRGIRHAFGLSSGFTIMGPSGDDTESFRQHYGHEAFDKVMSCAGVHMERSILRGPADKDDEDALRAFGWNPDFPASITERRAEQERELKKILDGDTKWRRGRLRDLVSTRELVIEFENISRRVLAERGIVLKDVMWDLESGRRLVRSMPSTEVAIELKTAWHRNGQREWAVNDIFDIDALALATPYCDVVVTEKACHHILSIAGLAERLHTSLLNRLADLPRILSNTKPKNRTNPQAR